MAEFCLGKLRWDEDKLWRADLNAIYLAQRGYADEWDDWNRLMFTAAGGKYPDKSKTMPDNEPPMSFRKMMEKRRATTA